ncbi:MAG: hypothetical protein PHS24_00135 [Bacilli bacterium]|nr:hypothetical protein [Bacilli bacterium]
MEKIKNTFLNLSKIKKIILSIIIISFILLIFNIIPTLAEFIYNDSSISTSAWDGTVASSFRSGDGTENNPYIISNGSELAYLSFKLKNTSFINSYFEITNNIILNEGILKYNDNDEIEYILDDVTYYIEPYTNNYYDNAELNGIPSGTLNILSSLDSFEGTLTGNNNTIYGLYVTSEVNEELALFTNLKGNVSNLFVKNALVYGGIITSGFASKTSNVTLENIFMDGYVIGKKNNIEKTIVKDIVQGDINVYNYETTNYINLSNLLPFLGSTVNSAKITGNYVVQNPAEASISINNIPVSGGSFEIELGTTLLSQVPIKASTTLANDVITFSNLKYTVKYNYGISGGLIGQALNTTIKNSVNKSDIYGYFTSAGIVANATGSINLINSYNIGSIDSNLSSGGLIGTAFDNVNNIIVNNSYNKGNLISTYSGGLISVVTNSSNVIFNNVFNTSNNNSINKVDNSTVSVTNAYYTENILPIGSGSVTGSFTKVLKEDLENKSYVIQNLNYNEYVSDEDLLLNPNNIWVYNDDENPVLYYDNNTSKTINVYIGSNIYNTYHTNINNKYFNANITFTVDGLNNFTPVLKVAYYISESGTVMDKSALDSVETWQLFTQINQITTEGSYIIYFKITDYKDRVTYVNTDYCILDLNAPVGSISFEDDNWDTLNNAPSNLFVNKPKEFIIESSDYLSGLESTYYYLSNEIILEENLENLEWIVPSGNILIDTLGKYIIYVKAIDKAGNIKYINTDYIIYNGYSIDDLLIGTDNKIDYGEIPINITNKSSITLKSSFTYEYFANINNYSHFLKSNILLPMGTKINLINHNNNKIYTYKIDTDVDQFGYNDSCDEFDLECEKIASYPFTLFNEMGQNENTSYIENIFVDNNLILEDYTLILDFKDAVINTSFYNMNIYLELFDLLADKRISTLENSYKKFNLYSNNEFNVDADLNLTSDYSGTSIFLNTESSTQINLNSQINYQTIEEIQVIDTTHEDQKTGLLISFVDSNGFLVNKKHFKNMNFKINNINYYPDNDNYLRAKINNNENIVLDIITTESENDLTSGTYYLKINNFISADGNYGGLLGNDVISIPIIVTNNSYEISHGFKVDFNNNIINKNDLSTEISFNISKTTLSNPNIRVSLYEKQELSAYNQNYLLVNLSNYINENLELISNNVYYLSKSNDNNISTTLNLKNNLFNYNSYKLILELYDGELKIDSIKKYFILK